MSDPNSSPVLPFHAEGRIAGARLCHFTSGSSELLYGHKDWLATHFVPKIRQNPNAWIDFFGSASPTGGSDSNLALSKQRLEAVERHVKSLYPNIKINVRKAEGEADAASFKTEQNNNGGYWRAVLIRWFGVSMPIPVPPYPAEVPDWVKRIYRLVPTADSWRAAADGALVLARGAELAVRSGNLPTPEQARAFDLVNRVFKFMDHPGQTSDQSIQDIDRIRGVFRETGFLLGAIARGDRYLHEGPQPASGPANAYTSHGGWQKRDPKNFGIYYVKDAMERATDDFIVDATIHECAHFCGPSSGPDVIDHAVVNGQKAYGLLALQLSKVDALVNASSYAWLAYLARKPSSQWLTAT